MPQLFVPVGQVSTQVPLEQNVPTGQQFAPHVCVPVGQVATQELLATLQNWVPGQQLVPQVVVPVAQPQVPEAVSQVCVAVQQLVVPQAVSPAGHSHWHVVELNTNGGLHAGTTHWPETRQSTVPAGQVQTPLRGSQTPLQHSEFCRHFCSPFLHRPRASSSACPASPDCGPVGSSAHAKPSEASAAPAIAPPSRRSTSRRETPPARALATASKRLSISLPSRAELGARPQKALTADGRTRGVPRLCRSPHR